MTCADQLRLVCACEAVIGFAIYGSADFRCHRTMYPKEIKEDLGLLIKRFKNRPSNSRRWRDICVGLSGLKNVRLSPNNEVVCTAQFPLNRMYTMYLSNSSRKLLDNYFARCNDNDPISRQVILNGVTNIITDFLIAFSFKESSCTNETGIQSWEKMRNFSLKMNRVTLSTPKEYCDWLFKNEGNYYNDMMQVIQQCKNIFPVDLFNKLPSELCDKIEAQIRVNGCMLMAPKQKHTKFALLPHMFPLNANLSQFNYYSHQYLVLSNLQLFLKATFPNLKDRGNDIEKLILKKLDALVQQENTTLVSFVEELVQELS